MDRVLRSATTSETKDEIKQNNDDEEKEIEIDDKEKDYSFIQSERHKPILVHQGYLYHHDRSYTRKHCHYYRCTIHQCHGTASLRGLAEPGDEEGEGYVVTGVKHNHPADEKNFDRVVLRNVIRNLAEETIQTPKEIFDIIVGMKEISDEVKLDLKSLTTKVNKLRARLRRKLCPEIQPRRNKKRDEPNHRPILKKRKSVNIQKLIADVSSNHSNSSVENQGYSTNSESFMTPSVSMTTYESNLNFPNQEQLITANYQSIDSCFTPDLKRDSLNKKLNQNSCTCDHQQQNNSDKKVVDPQMASLLQHEGVSQATMEILADQDIDLNVLLNFMDRNDVKRLGLTLGDELRICSLINRHRIPMQKTEVSALSYQ